MPVGKRLMSATPLDKRAEEPRQVSLGKDALAQAVLKALEFLVEQPDRT